LREEVGKVTLLQARVVARLAGLEGAPKIASRVRCRAPGRHGIPEDLAGDDARLGDEHQGVARLDLPQGIQEARRVYHGDGFAAERREELALEERQDRAGVRLRPFRELLRVPLTSHGLEGVRRPKPLLALLCLL